MDGRASSVGRWAFTGMAVFLAAILPVSAQYGGGSGTADNPYLIRTAEQMSTIGLSQEDWDKHFKLAADIDLQDLSGTVFCPIGKNSHAFTGVFDGSGHTISNLIVVVTGNEEPGDDAFPYYTGFGLFGLIDGPDAEIRDLGLLNPDVRPAFTCPKRVFNVGALAGFLRSGSISNCYVQGGQVQGDRSVGGLMGSNQGLIRDCYATCEVRPAEERPLPPIAKSLEKPEALGGLAGSNYGEISNCYATGMVTGWQAIGGLIGETAGTVQNSWATGYMSGDSAIGGLIGQCRRPATVAHCHAKAYVSGRTVVGGLVGSCFKQCRITDCFASGSVLVAQQAGGLVGCHEGDVSRCYSTATVSVTSGMGGGLVGLNGGTIAASWAGGSVAGGAIVGGLVGLNMREDIVLQYNPVVKDSYARAYVHGENGVGGLMGSNQRGAVVRCYSTSRVRGETADSVVSGLACTSGDATLVKDSFWDIETSGLSVSDTGTGKTTSQMQSMWTYIPAGWDFVGEVFNGRDDVWKMCCGRPIYPKLAWEPMLVGDFVDPEGVGPEDLAFLFEHWLQTTPFPGEAPDLNCDARVDVNDFVLLAQCWGRGARDVIFETTLDVSPGWEVDGQWQFGRPTGRGGTESGNPDPAGGYTGNNVYAVNLNGDYSVSVDGPHYLTAGPFDCGLSRDVKLQFARWLNTDEADFVHVTIEISTDGSTWTEIWKHEDAEAVLADDAWQVIVYSLGPIADHQESLYLRWGYEIRDEKAWPMSGWNIDDVVLTGVQE